MVAGIPALCGRAYVADRSPVHQEPPLPGVSAARLERQHSLLDQMPGQESAAERKRGHIQNKNMDVDFVMLKRDDLLSDLE